MGPSHDLGYLGFSGLGGLVGFGPYTLVNMAVIRTLLSLLYISFTCCNRRDMIELFVIYKLVYIVIYGTSSQVVFSSYFLGI